MIKFNHFCVPVKEIPKGAGYVKLLDVHVSDYADDPLSVEYLFVPKDNKILPSDLRTKNHIAFDTDEFDAIKSKSKVLYEFICPKDNVSRMAFVNYNGALVELKEVKE